MENTSYIMDYDDSDSDYSPNEEEDNTVMIETSVQEQTHRILDEFKTFLETDKFINERKSDPTTQFVNLSTGIKYCLPPKKINKFFRYLEVIRREQLKGIMWMERQYFTRPEDEQENVSGIFIDLDIYQKNSKSQFTEIAYNTLFQHIASILAKYLAIEEHLHSGDGINMIKIHVVVTKRNKICKKNDSTAYKDGIHIKLPGVMVNKKVKKLLIDAFANESASFFQCIKTVDQNDIEVETPSISMVDKQCASVPVFFFGCVRELTRVPYILDRFVEIQFPFMNNKLLNPIIKDITDQYSYFNGESNNKPMSNWVHEFSLTSECKNSIIKKLEFKIRDIYQGDLSKYNDVSNNTDAPETYGELDIRRLSDPNYEFMQEIVDTLSKKRADEFELWFQVLCALAHSPGDMKGIAEAFSKKSKKYNPIEFEDYWQQAKAKKANYLTQRTIFWWAKNDNPDRYKVLCSKQTYNLILRKVFDGITEGRLGHFDIAEIFHKCVPYKYIYSPNHKSWFEFIMEEDDHKSGEIYKWRQTNGQPISMRNYISIVLPVLFKKILNKITDMQKKATKHDAEYIYMIKKNFQESCRQLKNSNFKSYITRECEDLYRDINFVEQLDRYPHILGISDGIIILGEQIICVRGVHPYMISNYCAVKWMEFNPRHPTIKKLLFMYRDLFPPDVPDTHEFFMCLYASSLDAKEKESMFIIKLGAGKNGKTITTEIHRNTLGMHNIVTLPYQFITIGGGKRDAESSSPVTMKLETARHVDFQEPETSEVASSSKIKLITGQGSIGGRENFGKYITFKPHCSYVLDTNYVLLVYDNSHGFWRRMKLIRMPMRFHHDDEEANMDPQNPNHKKAIDIDKNDPEVLSAYLAILCYYYERLQTKYSGKVCNIPHEHIIQDTEEYRNSQDKLNAFINEYFIKCKDGDDSELLLDDFIEKYKRWYDKKIGTSSKFGETALHDIENSKIAHLIKVERKGTRKYFVGYRLYEFDGKDGIHPGEEWYYDIDKNKKNKKKIQPSYGVRETNEEYYDRICQEYDESQKNSSRPIHPATVMPSHFQRKNNMEKIIENNISTNFNAPEITDIVDAKSIHKLSQENKVETQKKVQPKKVSLKKEDESDSSEEEDGSLSECSESEEESDEVYESD